jgi:hypothetical protein
MEGIEMTSLDCAKEVLTTSSCHLLRRRATDMTAPDGKVIPQYDIKPAFTGKKKGWFYLDTFTASAIMAVYNAISDENKAKIHRIPITKLADFAFQNVA